MTATYKIHHSPARARRGMKGWAVMERQAAADAQEDGIFEGGVWYAVETFETEAEAKAALAKLEG